MLVKPPLLHKTRSIFFSQFAYEEMEPKKSRFILSRSQSVCITHAVRTWAVDCFLLNLFPVLWRVPTARHGNFKKMCQMNEFLENKKRLYIPKTTCLQHLISTVLERLTLIKKKKKKVSLKVWVLEEFLVCFKLKFLWRQRISLWFWAWILKYPGQ